MTNVRFCSSAEVPLHDHGHVASITPCTGQHTGCTVQQPGHEPAVAEVDIPTSTMYVYMRRYLLASARTAASMRDEEHITTGSQYHHTRHAGLVALSLLEMAQNRSQNASNSAAVTQRRFTRFTRRTFTIYVSLRRGESSSHTGL